MMAAEYHFAKGMIKQLAALAMVAMAVGLSYLQKLCLERETAYSLFRAFVQHRDRFPSAVHFRPPKRCVDLLGLHFHGFKSLPPLISSFFFRFRKRMVGWLVVWEVLKRSTLQSKTFLLPQL